jgi:phosphoenolpyruvate synthase/pyruvate phosphate dikinase
LNGIVELKRLPDNAPIGELAENLLILSKKGFQIPKAYLLPDDSFRDFSEHPVNMYNEMKSELAKVIEPSRNYAVVSSNEIETVESLRGCALQNPIIGLDSVVRGIEKFSQRAQESPIPEAEVGNPLRRESSLVIIEIPPLIFSGLVFTKNPLNGLSETIIELIASKTDSDEIKSQQLIFKNGKLSDTGETPFCDLKILERIVAESTRIEKIFGNPVSLEWGYDGERILWFSVKLLHSLEGLNVYSNKISRDMLPGIILPLVWSVNAPINSSSWKHLITQLIGENNIDIRKMTKQFYYRAYFNMGIFGDFFNLVGMPRETLEIMMLGEAHKGNRPKMKMNMKMFRYMPRIGLFVLENVMIAKKINRFLHCQKQLIDSYNKDISDLDEEETWKTISKIEKLSEECAYNVIVVRLVRSFHHTILRSLLKRKGIRADIEFNTEDLKDVEPKCSLPALKRAYDALPRELKDNLEKGEPMSKQTSQSAFVAISEDFLQRFGHLSTSTVDMSKPQWRENPQFIINMIKNYQETPGRKARSAPSFPMSSSGLALRIFYRNFVDYEKYSLRLSFIYAYGYALFRKYFLHLGNLLRSRGYISESDDIFYLTKSEIHEIISFQRTTPNYMTAVERRKKEIAEYSDIVMPEVIFGDIPPPPVKKGSAFTHLKGLPSSKGYYEGTARVVTTTANFDKILPGDVLIIPYSDASWTPLFAKAGAVVSESGGLLSHCSIIAREYGIPAVVAVEGATRIPDKTRVAVDGYTGDILISQ